jgi:peptide/nickel transport system substrate-binding protein
MHRRLWLSVVMLTAGAGLLLAGAFASAAGSSSTPEAKLAAKVKRGGTFRVDFVSDVDHMDPALAYGTSSWWIEYATAAKLMNYPDAPAPRGTRLLPEVAAGPPRVSSGGRVYTFRIRRGYRFSNGRPVTAKHFQQAFFRNLQKEIQSPAEAFITDANGTNIVGATAVRDQGRGLSALTGVRVRGNRLTIRLTRSDPTFLAKLSMPFFQATWTGLPLRREVININDRNDLPSAGPYYVSFREPNRSIVVRRNPFYRRGAGRTRPQNIAEVRIKIGVSEEGGYREVLANQADEGPIPPAEHAGLARRFGVNRARYWVKPRVCIRYLAMNNDSPLFRNNTPLRRAVNYVIRRRAMVDQYGAFAGSPHDQILPPGMPGFRNANIYPLGTPNVARARRLARGRTRGGRAVYFFFNNSAAARAVTEVNRTDLSRIGLQMEPRGFRGFDLYDAAGVRGSEHSITQAGWCQDYPDPYDFINVLLFGPSIQAENNVNVAYMNSPRYNTRMRRAARLLGAARLRTYGSLDIDIMRNFAPWAVFGTINNRFLFSSSVDPRGLVYQPIYEDFAIPTLAKR